MAEADRLRAEFEQLNAKIRQGRQAVADTTFSAVTQVIYFILMSSIMMRDCSER